MANKIFRRLGQTCIMPFTFAMLAGCSQTSHLAEDEILYKGIKEISYGKKATSVLKAQGSEQQQQEGVITAVAGAINAVSDLLSGKMEIQATLDSLSAQTRDKTLSRAERDSLRFIHESLTNAYSEMKEELEAALSCAPNGAIFGSSSIVSPWPIGLYAYNAFVDSKTAVGKWIFNTFGKQPVYISSVNPSTRVQVARNVLRNYGFFNGSVEYDLLPMRDSLKAKIAYSIYPRELFRLGSIQYSNFPNGMDSLVYKNLRNTELHTGDAFSVVKLDAERVRISQIMRDSGYYNFLPEHIVYKADTIRRPGEVQLRVEPSTAMPDIATHQYVIGNTDITMLKYDDYKIVDSIVPGTRRRTVIDTLHRHTRVQRNNLGNVTYRYSGEKGKQPLRLGELRKYLFYQTGQPYNYTRMQMVKDIVASMGIYSQFTMKHSARPAADTLNPDTLDVIINAMLDKPYDSEFAASIVNKSNGQLGPGLSYGISKKNAFRRAETLGLKVYGSYEWQTGAQPASDDQNTLNSYELGGQLSLSYPRLIMPHGRLLSRRAKTSTDFSIDISWLNRASYYEMAQLRGDITYKYQGRRYISHMFTPLSLKMTSLLNRTEAFDEIMQRSPALEVSMRDQFVPSMEYTLNMTSRVKAHHPRAFTLTIKQAGNLTSCLYAAFGQGFDKQNKQILGVPFAQFVRAQAEYKQEVRLAHNTSLIGRVGVGVVYSYGNSISAPYSDLFCVGGANSIRAFCLRGVGPGNYSPKDGRFSYIDQTGDFKLELNAEYRFPIVGDLKGAVFFDAGNVWLMRNDTNRPGGVLTLSNLGDQLAVGTGAGVRYDMSFLVIRFDVGVGLHAPYETGKSGWYNMPKFGDSLGFHLAVGYPF